MNNDQRSYTRAKLDDLRLATVLERERRVDEFFPNKVNITETEAMVKDPSTGKDINVHVFSMEGSSEIIYIHSDEMSQDAREQACTELLRGAGVLEQ